MRGAKKKTKTAQRPYLIDVMSSGQKKQFYLLVILWLAAELFFWQWWFEASHVLSPIRFLISTLVLSWSLLLPGYFFFFVAKMKKTNPSLTIPPGLRVAMVVTKTPSEPFSVVKKTLKAMLRQKYPHDTWLADEDPSSTTIKWCQQHGVFISTRKGITEYHRPTWPRRTKYKEGNLAYFYDTHGYQNYDFVAQLDADHQPTKGYLEAMLRPLADPRVGYVSAPSVCDANAHLSWAARARLYAESIMHGALQFGYSDGWAPLCIGSHYTVRTSALKKIGGLGPELAEDHSTTLMMNAHGWKGVHALEAKARGDGPVSFPDCMKQEFQWSRSLVIILFSLMPKYLKRLPKKSVFQFLFSQLWYPLFGLNMLVASFMPVIALLTKTPWMRLGYFDFLVHSGLVTLSILAIVFWIKKNGWLRPQNSQILSWETAFFQITRWPWVFWGTTDAIISLVRKKQLEIRVTPKGKNRQVYFPTTALIPYGVLTIVFALTAFFTKEAGHAKGYYYFAIINSLIYLAVIILITIRHIYENEHVWAKKA